MNCRRAEACLSAYLDGELTGFEMLEVREHVTHCRDCERELNALRSVKTLFGRLPSESSTNPEFEDRLVQQVFAAVDRPNKQETFRLMLATSVATAAFVLFVLQVVGRQSVAGSPTGPRYDIARDQAYLAGADPMVGRAPVTAASYDPR